MPLASRSRSSRLDLLILAAISLGGIAAVVFPARFLALAPPCLVTLATGHACWGCGMTHALVAVAHLDLAGAWRANPLVVLVLPLLVLVYLRFAVRTLRGGRALG